jgi:hypothetical protein
MAFNLPRGRFVFHAMTAKHKLRPLLQGGKRNTCQLD